MLRVRAGGVRVGEEGIIEYVVSNLGRHSGEERGGDLRIDIWATGDLGNGGGFGGMLQGALALDVVEWCRWCHCEWLSNWNTVCSMASWRV